MPLDWTLEIFCVTLVADAFPRDTLSTRDSYQEPMGIFFSREKKSVESTESNGTRAYVRASGVEVIGNNSRSSLSVSRAGRYQKIASILSAVLVLFNIHTI